MFYTWRQFRSPVLIGRSNMGNPFVAAALNNLSTLRSLAESSNFDDQLSFIKMCDTLKLNIKHSAFHTDWDRQFVGTLIFNIAVALIETSKTPDMGYFDCKGSEACQKKLQEVKAFMEMNGAA